MRIAADFDDTLVDSASILVTLINFKHGTSFKLADISTWDWIQTQGPEFEKTFWQIHDLWDNTYMRRAMAPTDPYAFAVIKELVRNGNKVSIVTMNEAEAVKSIEALLFMHGIDEIPVRVLGRGSSKQKASMPYDIFIDDSPSLAEIVKKHPTKALILYDRPWNRGVRKSRNVFRAKNWLEVRDILDKIGAL